MLMETMMDGDQTEKHVSMNVLPMKSSRNTQQIYDKLTQLETLNVKVCLNHILEPSFYFQWNHNAHG